MLLLRKRKNALELFRARGKPTFSWTVNMDRFTLPATPRSGASLPRNWTSLRSPLRFLLGHTQLQKELTGPTLSTTSTPDFQLSGIPKGTQDRVAEITLVVTAEGIIRAMSITETDGARTSFTFTGDQPNTPLSDADFVFHPPAGIPLVNGPPV